MSPAKTAAPIEMLFGLWARMGRKNNVLDVGPAVLRYVVMATNFGTQFAINSFVGYNLGCMIASNTIFDSRGELSGSSYPIRHSRDRVSKGRCHGTHFGTKNCYKLALCE